MPGLFSIFNTSKSGLFAQQTSINVTSHNIANAETEGYSRQRATLVTTTPYTMPSMNAATIAGQLGTGVTVASIDRIRDSFLDYQIRVENGVNGHYTAKDKYLSQVENVLNEPTDSGISSLMSEFFNSWQDLSSSPQNTSTVAQQAYQLTNDLNSVYSQLTSIKDNAKSEIKSAVVDINSMLTQISQLNQQIKDVKMSGNNPNDLMDSRDLLLDQLSEKFGISIDPRKYEGIDVTTSNSSIYGDADDNGAAPLISEGGSPLNIVQANDADNINVATFSCVTSITKKTDTDGTTGKATYEVSYYKKGDTLSDDNKVTMYVSMTEEEADKLDTSRVLWANNEGTAYKVKDGKDASGKDAKVIDGSLNNNSTTVDSPISFNQLALFTPPSGELKGYVSVQNNVAEYQDELNRLAKSLAVSVNAIVSQSSTWVADNSGSPEGGINNFFVNGDTDGNNSEEDENNINAGNITVNIDILNDPSKIKIATKYDSNGNSLGTDTDSNRALAIAQLANSLMNIQSVTEGSSREELIGDIFATNDTLNNVYAVGSVNGGSTLDNYFNNLVNKVGMHEEEAKKQVDYEATQLESFTQSRESTSGVSLDEEMTNLIQFQHCYQANAKMISTVDELLDVVINGLKR
ncbi:flagellar hook-associated protein FlgK [Clostridium kluyveri]|uniref:Flagellar hook-associated protein 1 n=1 Tax=Clostridium kluyveri TaxID=1534 RepID=A0A1L5F8H0_CLOKL|nr:flagellar hook-associated protein FlgK [Clostridium kluyveri]APM39305.1 flagellar hook-associated protein FlgK [Clostridium kluyveri]